MRSIVVCNYSVLKRNDQRGCHFSCLSEEECVLQYSIPALFFQCNGKNIHYQTQQVLSTVELFLWNKVFLILRYESHIVYNLKKEKKKDL